jgi:cytoskeleton protein RodZ
MPRNDRGPLDRPDLMDQPRANLHPRDGKQASLYVGVGAQLRAQREQNGFSVEEVAQRLRIRLAHLQSIEHGRFDDLPGRIYAIGFIRSYAEFLDLDGQSVVELYKQETAGEEQPTKLIFPTPTPESRMPRVWLVVASVLAAVVLYYGWGRMQDRDLTTVERVPAVPDRLMAAGGAGAKSGDATASSEDRGHGAVSSSVGVDPVSTAQAASSPARAQSEPVPQVDATASAGPRGGAGTDVVRTAGREDDRAEDTRATGRATSRATGRAAASGSAGDDTFALADPETAPAAGRTSADVVVLRPPPAPRPLPTITAAADRVPAAAASGAQAAVDQRWPARLAVRTAPASAGSDDLPPPLPATTGASTSSRTEAGATSGGYVPQVYGIGNSAARVVVQATMDSWVQIRGGGNELLLTRILRAGDRYLAPDRPDLVLMTGNAGGLEIRVDGKLLPPIGRVGAVQRDVSLYAESLLTGQSVTQ